MDYTYRFERVTVTYRRWLIFFRSPRSYSHCSSGYVYNREVDSSPLPRTNDQERGISDTFGWLKWGYFWAWLLYLGSWNIRNTRFRIKSGMTGKREITAEFHSDYCILSLITCHHFTNPLAQLPHPRMSEYLRADHFLDVEIHWSDRGISVFLTRTVRVNRA